jgi:hypothetical protein
MRRRRTSARSVTATLRTHSIAVLQLPGVANLLTHILPTAVTANHRGRVRHFQSRA